MAELSDEDLALLEAIKELKIESKSDLQQYVQQVRTAETRTIVREPKLTYNYPRISLFFGEPGKGEVVSYRTWMYTG